jgi:hypothetical protein
LPKRTIQEGSGITIVTADLLLLGSEEHKRKRQQWSASDWWTKHFLDPEWLKDQLDRSNAAKPSDPRLFCPHEGWGWYVEQTLTYRTILGNLIEQGKADQAAVYACELGRLMTEMEMKFNPFELGGKTVEQLAMSGRASVQGGRQGGLIRGTSDKIQDRRAEFFAAYDHAIARNVDPTVARQRTAQSAGYNDDYARKLLKRRKTDI